MDYSVKSIFKGTSIYTIAKIFNKAGAILLLPILTRLLTPEEYGVIGLLNPIITFIPLFLAFGLYISQMRDYVKLKNDSEKLGSYIFSLNSFLWGINSLVFILLVTPLGKQLISYLIDYREIAFYPYVFIALLIGFIKIFNLMARNYFQTIHDFKRVGISSIIGFLLSSSISLFLIYYFDFGALGRIIGKLISSVFLFIILYLTYLKKFKFEFNKKYLTDSLNIGVPMMFSGLLGIIINYSDRIILGKFLSLDIVGVYSLAYTGANVLNLFITSFNDTWKPIFYNILKENKDDKKVKDVLVYFVFILALISLLGQLFGKEIIYLILPKDFNKTTIFLPLLLPAILMIGVYQYLDNFLHYYRDTKFSLIFTSIAVVLNLGINILFIPKYGAMVAVWSTIIAFAVKSILYFILINIKYNIEFKYYKLFIIVLYILNPGLIYLVNLDIGLYSFILKIIYFILYIILGIIFIVGIDNMFTISRYIINKKNE